ncbi:hypothetical protein ACFB49_14940 [Sphingomonas sp. DBB INV C78]
MADDLGVGGRFLHDGDEVTGKAHEIPGPNEQAQALEAAPRSGNKDALLRIHHRGPAFANDVNVMR